jgi:RHS repeat-associated protein
VKEITYDQAEGYSDTGFDPASNRQRRISSAAIASRNYGTYDANNRLGKPDNNGSATAVSEKVLTTFDEQGNTLRFDLNANGNWDEITPDKYDVQNLLIEAVRNGKTIRFVYDANGNRVSKEVDQVKTLYLIDDRNPTGYAQVIEERVPGGAKPTVVYTYGLDLVSQTRGAAIHYYGYDGQGSVRYLTGGTPAGPGIPDGISSTYGQITDTYYYDAFGVDLGGGTGSTPNHYRYTGEYWDADLGMYYLRARWYHPDLGRFWTMDTFEGHQSDPLSLHKYLYAHGDPVNNTDPSGHETLPSLMTGFTIKAIGFRMLAGGAVGVWDANFRGYSQWEGLAYGALGGAIGPVIPWQLGITLTGYGIGEALMDGDYDSALFRGATAVVGVGSMRWAKSLPGGRLGNLNTQLQNSKIAIYLQSKGWKIRSGGGQGAEERIPGPGGRRKGETWVDITAEKNGTTLRVQTVDTLGNGAPTPRELNAASRIRAAFPGDKLLLVPKADAGASVSTTPPLFRGAEDDE